MYKRYVNGRSVYEYVGRVGKIGKSQLKDVKAKLDFKYSMGGGGTLPGKMLFTEALQRYVTQLELYASPKHLKDQKSRMRMFSEFFCHKFLVDIDKQIVVDYLAAMTAHGNQITTIRNKIRSLNCFLNWAVKEGYLSTNPAKNVCVPKANKKQPVFLTQNQAAQLLDICDEMLRPMVAVALFTGMRAGEMQRLRWEDINVKHRSISIHKSKNHKFRVVYFSDELLKYIDIKDHKTGSVFNSASIPLRKRWDAVRRVAGLNHVRWHDLRHTFASWLVMSGVDLTTVKELMGHSSLESTMIYAHLSSAHKQKAAAQITICA